MTDPSTPPATSPTTAAAASGRHWPSVLGLAFMRVLARLPLPWVRALGWLLGTVLHALAGRRRRIALTNWRLCFPEHSGAQARTAIRRHFVYFAQAWLDRSWLWEGAPAVVRQRITLVGEVDALKRLPSAVLFAPHFVGMDAGWTGITAHLEREFCGIYAEQLNPEVDRWMARGRSRFGHPHIVEKRDGAKPMVAALRSGKPLYLLPDMDHGLRDSVFASFFGVQAATLTSLPRFAQLGRAPVVPVTTRITPGGVEVRIWPAWQGYPTKDLPADVNFMNRQLENMVRQHPEQYYWVHKRFKTRPPDEAPFY